MPPAGAGHGKAMVKELILLARSRAAQSEVSIAAAAVRAELSAAGEAAAAASRRLHAGLRLELDELSRHVGAIPTLVRSIWGAASHEAVALALRQRARGAAAGAGGRCAAADLIARWQDAEHRLIAAANSLATLAAGRKLVAVGAPLAASSLLWGAPAHCRAAAEAAPRQRAVVRRPLLHAELVVAAAEAVAAALRLAVASVVAELRLAVRGAYLAALFLPLALGWPLASALGGRPRAAWMALATWTIERAGCAFIKWAQWAATRPDIFPADACAAMAKLQSGAPTHGWAHTRAAVEAAFGRPLGALFSEFETAPVASGSVAQVHRARLTPLGAALAAGGAAGGAAAPLGGLLPLRARRRGAAAFAPGDAVAVKVRHPGVESVMEADFALMQRAAAAAGAACPAAAAPLRESLMQFGAPLREQLDLAAEAAALDRFGANFAGFAGVRFPRPAAAPLRARDVLVETFEPGAPVSAYVDGSAGGAAGRRLADLGLRAYLQMLLRDNYVHADLHPGNILVDMGGEDEGRGGGAGAGAAARPARRLAAALGLRPAPRAPGIVLLDVGMTAALEEADRGNLVAFFAALTSLDGAGVADAVARFSAAPVAAPAAFRDDMRAVFAGLDADALRANTPAVVADVMDTVRRHGVTLRGAVSTVVMTSLVLEGWSSRLDPDVRVLEAVKGVLPRAWRARAAAAADALCAPPLARPAEAAALAW